MSFRVPALVPGRELRPLLTIGTDAETANGIEGMGARNQAAGATEVAVDREKRIATTPGDMRAGRISEVADGAENLVRALLALR